MHAIVQILCQEENQNRLGNNYDQGGQNGEESSGVADGTQTQLQLGVLALLCLFQSGEFSNALRYVSISMPTAGTAPAKVAALQRKALEATIPTE